MHIIAVDEARAGRCLSEHEIVAGIDRFTEIIILDQPVAEASSSCLDVRSRAIIEEVAIQDNIVPSRVELDHVIVIGRIIAAVAVMEDIV
jgi:hypothetical protein